MTHDRPESNSINENMKKCCPVCGMFWVPDPEDPGSQPHPTGPDSTCYRYRPKPEPATDVDAFVAKIRAAFRDGYIVVPNGNGKAAVNDQATEATIMVNGVPRVLLVNRAANGEAKGA